MGMTITHFMWGYQPHFRIGQEIVAKRTFQILDENFDPEIFLVGILTEEKDDRFLSCVEPEEDFWIKSEDLNKIYSIAISTALFLSSYVLSSLIPNGFILAPVLMLSISLSNFFVLNYNKNNDIFQNISFLRLTNIFTNNLFYISINFGLSIISINLIEIVLLENTLKVILNYSVVAFLIYLTLTLIDENLKFYNILSSVHKKTHYF